MTAIRYLTDVAALIAIRPLLIAALIAILNVVLIVLPATRIAIPIGDC